MLIIGYRDRKVRKKLEAAALFTIQAPRTLASAQLKADLYSRLPRTLSSPRGKAQGLLLSAKCATELANAVSTRPALNVLLFVPA